VGETMSLPSMLVIRQERHGHSQDSGFRAAGGGAELYVKSVMRGEA